MTYFNRRHNVRSNRKRLRRFNGNTYRRYLAHADTTCSSSVTLLCLRLVNLILLRRTLMIIVRQCQRMSLNVILTCRMLIRRYLCLLKLKRLLRIRITDLTALFTLLRHFTRGLVDLLSAFITSVPTSANSRRACLYIEASTGTTILSLLLYRCFLADA